MNNDCGFKDETASRLYDDKTTRRGQSIGRIDWAHYNPQSQQDGTNTFMETTLSNMYDGTNT
jgi:hypothetical protein